MVTIEEVVEKWNKKHPNMQTETLRERSAFGGKIRSGKMYNASDKEAIIKLSEDFNFFEPWSERTCYVFTFKYDLNENITDIYISFQRRTKYASNTQELYNFLGQNFKNKEIKLIQGRKNPNHLVLQIEFNPKSATSDEICNCMEKFIEQTREKIIKFLTKTPYKEELSTEKMIASNEKKDNFEILFEEDKALEFEEEKDLFKNIMIDEYKINEDKNKEFYSLCKKMYLITIKILEELFVDVNIEIKVSHYTRKNVANKLLVATKDENNKCSEFRLTDAFGMNDPKEGKTLLSFLDLENEDIEEEIPEDFPFIACFSLEPNSLNQFRLYGKESGKEATGVSIVFKHSFFDYMPKTELYRCVYINPKNTELKLLVSYSEEEKKESVEKIQDKVRNLFEELKKLCKEIKNIYESQKENEPYKNFKVENLLTDLLVKIRYIVKNYAFKEEQECRIIKIRNNKDSSIKIDGNRLYIEVGEIKNNVDRIYFAPLAEGLEVFAVETGIKCIIRSRHPFKQQ